jgi:hypothetical protein
VHWIVLFFLLTTSFVEAHEILSITQQVNIRKQDEIGWQQDLIARLDFNQTFDFGAQATYLERFDFYENRAGGFVVYRPNHRLTLQARYLQGSDNEILPEKQAVISAYYAAAPGLTPYLYYQDTRYSVTHLHAVNLGIEIEKIPYFLIIPSIMGGRATFKSPAKSDDVYSYGLRVSYFQEKKFAVTVFGYKGREASQAIIGRSTELVDTLTGGLGATYYLTSNVKSELIFDHTDYDQLNTEFHTTTLLLSWMF